ncbi:hypothetical protein BC833DRAFT_618608 [Globomyces pollinis-pini]|nr:hypothetical protein BC833DRAFT_618608 [Globomyces pollinis-pini]KAJ3000257.1 NTF2- export protein 2 [Globomyces sp. JEL0801]
MNSQVIDITGKAADKFISSFYNSYDSKRNLVSSYYAEQSIMLWNGNPFSGSQQINTFILSFPTTEHVILSYDAQPIPQLKDDMDFMLTVYGTVAYGKSKPKKFSEVFVLTKHNSQYLIGSDTFRFV